MQEHIRRAHPEYYLPKLPATKESFELMITTSPHEVPEQQPTQQQHHHHIQQHHPQHADPSSDMSPAFNLDVGLNQDYQQYGHALGQHDGGYYTAGDTDATAIFNSMQAQQRSSDEYRRGSLIPAASAAAALAQLHYHRPDSDWGGNDVTQVIFPLYHMSPTITEADFLQIYADPNNEMKSNHFGVDPQLAEDQSFMQSHPSFPVTSEQHQPGLLPNAMANSPPPEDRETLPPHHQRRPSTSHVRPRKTSLSQHARLAKHERRRSKDLSKRNSGERKAFSAEPGATSALGKRWEDLIDAATSATEEDSRDLTPVSTLQSPLDIKNARADRLQIPASPYQSPHQEQVPSRTSMPPFALGSQFQSYQASPLNQALTPPAPEPGLDLQNFPSVESSLSSNLSHQHHNSAGSGSQFHIMNPTGMNSDSSPMFQPPVHIYCSGCRRRSILKDCYGCTNCMCGICSTCVEAIVSGQSNGRMSTCPRCNDISGNFKQFQLDLP